ncbi:MAG: tetratricopeptide repeat protein, partial [Rhodospirillales bacterium]|nr:tetratricopeptide repeat protein [Rhodospirillales bacterium]
MAGPGMALRLSHSFSLLPAAPRPARDPAIASAETHRAAGRPEDALAALDGAVESAEALHLRGVLLHELGRPSEALTPLRRAVTLAPAQARAHYHLGNALLALDLSVDAADAFAAAIAIDPGFADAHNNRGNALRKQGRELDALDAYRAALMAQPGFAPALYNAGLSLAKFGEFAAAIDCYRAILSRPPASGEEARWPMVWEALSGAQVEQGAHDDAVASCRAWLRLTPGAALAEWNLGLSLLALGEYAEGWRLYERRWEIEGFRDESERDQPLPVAPSLADLAGKHVLVRREQGRGDLIQFARYAPMLARHAASVTLTAFPELVS